MSDNEISHLELNPFILLQSEFLYLQSSEWCDLLGFFQKDCDLVGRVVHF